MFDCGGTAGGGLAPVRLRRCRQPFPGRGQGPVGSGLREANARGQLLCVETSAPEVVTYYKRSGFEEEMSEDMGGPRPGSP